jgi:OHCU decarboxylase
VFKLPQGAQGKKSPGTQEKSIHMTLKEFNLLDKESAKAELLKCCGSEKWASLMIQHLPFQSDEELHNKAASIWYDECNEEDWLEAFQHHPKIGDVKSLQSKFASTKEWAGAEQASVQEANDEIIEELAIGNKAYEEKFGFIFIVCATGKSAEEMLLMLKQRLANDYDEEIRVAMQEQSKITQIRLKKLIHD